MLDELEISLQDDTRRLLAMMLKRQGADVTSVSSSSEALRVFERTGGEAEAQPRGVQPGSPAGVGRSERAQGEHDGAEAQPPGTQPGSPACVERSERAPDDLVSTLSGSVRSTGELTWGGSSRRPLDVIVSDIGMPEEDGYELMRKVRALQPQQGGLVPAIALTGYAARKDQELALAAGYQLHLAKPVEPEDLVAAIASLVLRRD